MNKKRLVIYILVLLVFISAVYFYFFHSNSQVNIDNNQSLEEEPSNLSAENLKQRHEEIKGVYRSNSRVEVREGNKIFSIEERSVLSRSNDEVHISQGAIKYRSVGDSFKRIVFQTHRVSGETRVIADNDGEDVYLTNYPSDLVRFGALNLHSKSYSVPLNGVREIDLRDIELEYEKEREANGKELYEASFENRNVRIDSSIITKKNGLIENIIYEANVSKNDFEYEIIQTRSLERVTAEDSTFSEPNWYEEWGNNEKRDFEEFMLEVFS